MNKNSIIFIDKKTPLKLSSAIWRPFFGLDMLRKDGVYEIYRNPVFTIDCSDLKKMKG